MSLRYEQHRALLKARALLRDMMDPQRRPRKAGEMRHRAADALKHFPPLTDAGEPLWSGDTFSPPESCPKSGA
jgi:hypothetical protein